MAIPLMKNKLFVGFMIAGILCTLVEVALLVYFLTTWDYCMDDYYCFGAAINYNTCFIGD
jgi:hypothetical protein